MAKITVKVVLDRAGQPVTGTVELPDNVVLLELPEEDGDYKVTVTSGVATLTKIVEETPAVVEQPGQE